MIAEEFDHYFRLCMNRPIDSKEAKLYLFAVADVVSVEPDHEGVVMVYHTDDIGTHCYDIRLTEDVASEQGDQILTKLEAIFPTDDFECESSMELAEQHRYINQAILEQIRHNSQPK